MKHFQEIKIWPIADAEAERHKVSLLRRLLESAGGRRDDFQHTLNEKRSINDNFGFLGELLGINAMQTASFDSFDVLKVREVLIQCDPFQFGELDAAKLLNQICRFVPVGFSEEVYRTLPANIINNLEYGIVLKIRCLM